MSEVKVHPLLTVTPEDLLANGNIKPDIGRKVVWFYMTDRMPRAALVNMIWDGEAAFRQKCRKKFGNLGLRDVDYAALWQRLVTFLPGVATVRRET